MQHIITKTAFFSIFLLFVGFALPADAKTVVVKEQLVKCETNPAVYLVQNGKTAQIFPDKQTFFSYNYQFDQVSTIACDPEIPFKIKGDVPNKFGKGFRLIKKVKDPAVFKCEYKNSYAICDKIANAQEAEKEFGANWPQQIYETHATTMDMLVWHWKKETMITKASSK